MINTITERELRNYQIPGGSQPFTQWIVGIKDKVTRARVLRRLDRLRLGHYGDVKSVGKGVFELRLQFGSGYRVYFAESSQTIIILLCGGDKKTQAVDIQRAQGYWKELQERCQ